ncbi:MAG: peptidoglycan-binding protein [Candidatus Pacebacteria bacterium]|jgi:hypothetical protein|nr:peptidoglycan-binding protein [Candidatus Paceibacterota bacterium]
MNKRQRLILITAIVLLALCGVFVFFSISQKRVSLETPTLREFFTFGRSNQIQTERMSEPSSQRGEEIDSEARGGSFFLKQITSRPVAGAAAVSVSRKIINTEINTTENETTAQWTRDLKEGDTGEDVRELQIFLNTNIEPSGGSDKTTIVAIKGAGSKGNETTYFGTATTAALRIFQEKFEIESTGIADERTRKKIFTLQQSIPKEEKVTAVRYVDKRDGTIFQTFIDTIEEKKISGTKIPKIHEAYFGKDALTTLLRLVEEDGVTIATYAGTLPKIIEGGDSITNMRGSFIERNIESLSFSPDKSKFFYLVSSGQFTNGIIASATGGSKIQVFSSPFSEWLPQWVDDRTIALTTKPAASFGGYLYTLDTKTKEFKKVMSEVPGLTTLYSPNGKKVLYSRATKNRNSFLTAIYDTETKKSTDLDVHTLPEKCVWSNDSITLYCSVPKYINGGEYPDVWYQGIQSFSDMIWQINTKDGILKRVSDPFQEAGIEIDGIHLFLDTEESNLFLTNKNDSSLWTLTLN